MNEHEARQTLSLALGRIFRLASRPEQHGDVASYEAARRAALDAADVLGISGASYRPNAARDLLGHRD